MNAIKTRLSLQPLQLWLGALALIMASGVVAALLVFWKGLVITNLSDLVPWGLWITIDLSSIALSAGAFTLCAAVYLLGLKQFQPVARTATYIGVIGYSMAMMCLLLDIGRPDRFWHGFVFWNPHSVLWEVTMCVGLYFTVLILETLPIIGGVSWVQDRLPRVAALFTRIHHFAPYLAVAGLGLSMLHQSSLGATYGVLKSRPLWYQPGLSVLFMISAIAGGISLTTLATMLAANFSPKLRVDDELLNKLAYFIGWVLVVYLYFRFWDAFSMTYTYEPGRTEGLRMLTKGSLAFNFWVGEILLGAAVPILILLNARARAIPRVRMMALAMVVGGLVAYRWDVNLAGQLVVMSYMPREIITRYVQYFPSLVEFAVGAGIVAYGLLAFTLGVRYLNVVDHRPETDLHEAPVPALAGAD
jgi:Ni/Fe-hydrogenase subunit HybB-like protein